MFVLRDSSYLIPVGGKNCAGIIPCVPVTAPRRLCRGYSSPSNRRRNLWWCSAIFYHSSTTHTVSVSQVHLCSFFVWFLRNELPSWYRGRYCHLLATSSSEHMLLHPNVPVLYKFQLNLILEIIITFYGLGLVTCYSSVLLLIWWISLTFGRTSLTWDQAYTRLLPPQDSTTLKHEDKLPCLERESNPRSQYPRG